MTSLWGRLGGLERELGVDAFAADPASRALAVTTGEVVPGGVGLVRVLV